jgi:alkylation response protein AidB-like acyl-CoA dehydrogenase
MAVAIEEQLDTLIDRIWVFMREEVYPLEPRLLQEGFGALLPTLAEKRRQVKELGLWAPHLPVAYGGLGLSLPAFARVSEVLGHSPLGHYLFNCQAPDVGNMEILMQAGSPEQKERFLQPLMRGEIRSCFAMTEPENPGSNPVILSATAVKDGDDYVIDGHKWFTSAADGAAFAIAMVVTNPEAASPHQRASQIIVPTDTPGFRIVRNISIMGDAGEDYLSHSEVMFERCRVPRTNLLGEEGRGFALAQVRLGPGRIHHCMRWIGICERALDLMCRRAATRELAPGKLLATRQVIQHWIAEARAEINAARLLVLDTAEKMERSGGHAARVDVSIIKFFVANVLHKLLDRAIQVHGALGITDDTPLAFWYRHERGARIYDGADEVHKTVVAREVLKQYGVDISF